MTILTVPLLSGSLLAEQIETETKAVEMGVLRYNQLAKKAVDRGEGALLKPAERLLLYWYEPLREALVKERRSIRRGEPEVGRTIHGPVLSSIKTDRLAVVTLYEVLSAMMQESAIPLTRLAYAIGRAVVAEQGIDILRRDEREAYKALTWRYRRLSSKRVNAWTNKTLADPVWNRRVCVHAGVRLVWLVIQHCLLPLTDGGVKLAFHHERHRIKGKSVAMVKVDQDVLYIIDDGHAVRQYMRPRYLPMIVPPYPWQKNEAGTVQGGYVRIRTPFISKPTRAQKAALDGADLSEVYECLSAVSSAPFRINRRVLAVVEEAWRTGGNIGRMPLDDIPKPPRPNEFDNEKAEKAWKREAVKVHRANVGLRCERAEFEARLAVAKEFAGRDAIYFPHQLDFRSRAYPIPVHLNHQGDDVCRGLLEFAAKPADHSEERARFWLEVHAANCWGHDKMPFEDRRTWVRGFWSHIGQSCADPLNFTWWQDAEKPWQFLAACEALIDENAAAHLPIQMDGTCNGLQHYAAMGRDERGGVAVNLVGADAPADVYSDVLRSVEAIVSLDSSPIARKVLPLLSRAVVKQPVMTSVYGVTPVGAKKQVLARLKEAGLQGDELYQASQYLANVVLDGIGSVCSAATDIMDWLKDCARAIVNAGHTVQWTSPLGLPVVQPYLSWKKAEVETVMARLKVQLDEAGLPPRLSKQVNGIAPNVVHSIDATHMLMTARSASRLGITFAAVHDAYWTHAATADALGAVLRRRFVDLHERPLLGDLRREWQGRYRLDLPELPAQGNLDLNAVLKSPYFFS